jgi:hypothetical protein
MEKGLAGCWECEEGPCDKGIFNGPQAIRLKAFTRFIKTESPIIFVEYLLENYKQGIVFGPQNPYDSCTSEEKVIKLLTQGAKE